MFHHVLEITVIADGDLGLVAMMTHVTPATKNNIQKRTIDKSMIQNWKLKMVKQRKSVVIDFGSSEVNTSTKKIAKENEGGKEKELKSQIIVRKRGLNFICLFQFLL